jgi:Pyridoxamine 5'-phosphate oxidase
MMRFVTRNSSPLDPEHAAFVQGGVSIIAASRNANNEPSLSRAIGCRVAQDRRQVTFFLSAAQSGALLADLRANGAVAVVFSQPSTHRTLQLKGTDAAVTTLGKDDVHILAAYRQRLTAELAPLGFSEPFTRALFSCPTGDVVAVNFTVAEAFVQTPGPKAGTPLQAGR